MRNSELITKFVSGATSGKGSNLYIEGNKLINYTTCIAFRQGRKMYLNAKKYSQTTSVHQNRLRREAYEVFELGEDVFNNLIKEG